MEGLKNDSVSFGEIKKSLGTLIIETNTIILDLQDGMKRVKSGGTLTKQESEKEVSLKSKKQCLEEAAIVFKNNDSII